MLFGCPVDWFFAPLAGILHLKVANFTFLLYVLTVRPAAPEGNSCLCSSRFGIAVSCLQCGPECVRRGCAARVLLQCCEGRCKANGLLLSWINCILSKQASPPITRGMGSEHIRSNRAWRMRPSGLEDALRYLICYLPQSPPGLNPPTLAGVCLAQSVTDTGRGFGLTWQLTGPHFLTDASFWNTTQKTVKEYNCIKLYGQRTGMDMIAKILESRKQMDHRFIQMEKVKTQAGSKGNLGWLKKTR